MKKLINNFYQYMVRIFFAIIVLWLFLLAGFSTSYISADGYEHTFFVKDSLILNILFLTIFIVVVCLIIYVISDKNVRNPILKERYISIFMILAGLAWVISTQYKPGADQKYVIEAAKGLRTGDYSMFRQDGYVNTYPNQLGIIFLFYITGWIAGDNNYIFIQLLNVVALAFTYKMISEICCNGSAKRKNLLLMCLVLFFPFGMYVSFVYGNIIGLFFAILSIKYCIKIIKDDYGKSKYTAVIIAALSIVISVMIKNNYLIFMIGIIICLLIELIKKPKFVYGISIAFIIILYIIQSIVLPMIVRNMTGEQLSKGASPWSWVVMGLEKNNVLCDGWYSGYNKSTFEESGYNTEIQGEMAKNKAAKLISDYIKNPEEAAVFFSKKTASQWNNPSFQGFWILQVRKSNVKENAFIKWMLSIKGEDIIMIFLNIGQYILLFFTLVFIVLKKNKDEKDHLFMMVFIGGFLFHLIWEAKCQYTVIYYVLIIPLAVDGFILFCSMIKKRMQEPNKTRINIKDSENRRILLCTALITGMAIALCLIPVTRKGLQPEDGTEDYYKYLCGIITCQNIINR